MSRIRIEIKANPSGDMVTNWSGARVFLVCDDGSEHAIDNVEGVTIRCRQGEVSSATIDVEDVELRDSPGTAYRNPFLNAVVDVSQIRTVLHPEADE